MGIVAYYPKNIVILRSEMVPGGSPPRMKREPGGNPGQYPLL